MVNVRVVSARLEATEEHKYKKTTARMRLKKDRNFMHPSPFAAGLVLPHFQAGKQARVLKLKKGF
jgi:hypothetical protein